MKNIHILPTDKPSRLIFQKNLNKLMFYRRPIDYSKNDLLPQNIYITSDEEIKEGDWLFSTKTNNLFKADSIEYLESHNMIEDFDKSFYINSKYTKKIILTDNKDLIKDGVQAIDDEFLQWFVKNPKCEEVEINRDWGYPSIIIPKEEPKTNLEKLPFPELVKEFAEYYKNVPLVEEPKQETIEEAAKLYADDGDWELDEDNQFIIRNTAFVKGAKSDAARDFWYEQFKKK